MSADCAHLDSRVLSTRLREEGTARRRECADCGARFTTMETIIAAKAKRAPARANTASPGPGAMEMISWT